MEIITVDFETYYDKDYSLSKMQTDAYVLDERFQVIGVGVKVNGNKSRWFTREQIPLAFASIHWPSVAVLAHNTAFDGFILAHKYGIKPKMWMDTLGMARGLYPWLPSHALGSLAKSLGVGVKGTEVIDALGKRLEDFTPAELFAYGEYCKNDCDLEYALFDMMRGAFPLVEYTLVDKTLRMFTEPKFQLNKDKLVAYRDAIIASKQALLDSSGEIKDTLMSNPKFADALRAYGVEPPMKVSPTTKKMTYAFAKSDKGLTDLLEHPDADVQALVAARLGNKTTIAETRAQKFIETADRGIGLPIFLNFWGAKTTGRFSGGNSINMTNLPNRGKDRLLRESMEAPAGHTVIVGDSANIELRVNMALSGQTDMLAKIVRYDQQGAAAVSDLYCDFATEIYGRVIGKGDKAERTIGKIGELSLGYGAGDVTFQNMLRVQAGVSMPPEECERIVSIYRRTHDKVKSMWDYCGQQVLNNIKQKNVLTGVDRLGIVLTTEDGFAIPGQLGVVYKNLYRDGTGEWRYMQGRSEYEIYGGKLAENLCQHVARHIVMWQKAKFAQRYHVALSVYDEIVAVVPDEEAEECARYLEECMRSAPKWCRGLIPLNCEVGMGKTYAEAK